MPNINATPNLTIMSWHTLFLYEIQRRIISESIDRSRKCLDRLSDEQIWYRPNEHSNSVGNLVQHCCGNARQWILAGLMGEPDNRMRDEEFDPENTTSKEELHSLLHELDQDLSSKLPDVTAEQLTASYTVQGFEENGIGILIHVAEHFSYHVGQMTWIVKMLTNSPTGYYEGLDLNETGA